MYPLGITVAFCVLHEHPDRAGVLKAMGAPPKSSDKVIEHSNIEKLG